MERIPDVSQRVAEPADVRVDEGAGRLIVRRRRFGPVRARLARLFGVPADYTVHLDSLGSAAWRLMDGRRTVGEIRVLLVAKFPDQPDVGPRLGKFLGTLVSKGMVQLR